MHDNAGGGVYGFPGAPVVSLANSIVGRGPLGNGDDCSGDVNMVNPNLDSDGTCGASSSADPLLGPLVSIHSRSVYLPQSGSPAIGAGSNVTCGAPPVGGVDQNEALRPFGNDCDLGSVEVGTIAFVDGFDSGNTSGWTSSRP